MTLDTMPECTTLEQPSVVRFLWAKGMESKNIHKEMLPIYGEKCLSRQAVYNWVYKFSEGRTHVEDEQRVGRPTEIAAEANVQRLEDLGLLHTGPPWLRHHGSTTMRTIAVTWTLLHWAICGGGSFVGGASRNAVAGGCDFTSDQAGRAVVPPCQATVRCCALYMVWSSTATCSVPG